MPVLTAITAWEILDSRGRPTVKARCRLSDGTEASASVPSGASTGHSEALELRDGDPQRYRGLGCRQAVANIERVIAPKLSGHPYASQAELDDALRSLDGTTGKTRLGANALLAVSIAFTRACAAANRIPLHHQFAQIATGRASARQLPRLTVNLFSGGKHAGGQVAIQDVLIVPARARTVDESLATAFAVYQCAAELCLERYGARPLKADEGGLAPGFASSEAMLADATDAIRRAGFEPGYEVALAIDVASTHFYREGTYHLDGMELSSQGLIARLRAWCDRYPIVSLEDGLAEDDWESWPALRAALAPRTLVLGDDFLCTNPGRIARAVTAQACDALLLKVNQIGTLTEAAEAARRARAAGWAVTVSARSGETEDDWLADLAVAWGDQIKVGSIAQSERLAKYNRLLEIEAETGWPLPSWPPAAGTAHPAAAIK